MTEFKKNNYKFWHSPFALGLLFFVLIFFGYKIIDLVKKNIETAQKKEIISDKIKGLLEKESSLNKDIAKLETEEGKEQIIREKYQVAKENEKMVTIVDEENKINSLELQKAESYGFGNWIKSIFKK